jgi:hypothetical protein
MPGIRVLGWMSVAAATALLGLQSSALEVPAGRYPATRNTASTVALEELNPNRIENIRATHAGISQNGPAETTLVGELSGDPAFDGIVASAPALFASTTTLVSAPNPCFVGQAVIFTATVSSLAGQIPDGDTVQFEDASTTPVVVLGTATLSGGVATFTTTGLSRGAHVIQAIYQGDAEFMSSASSSITQTMRYPTSTNLVSNLNPSNVGQAVLLKATVSTGSGAPPDGELVSFSIDGSAAGTAALAAGQAVFTTTIAKAGKHSITATYPGDAINRVSSSTVSQLVNQAATTAVLSSSPSPSIAGQTVTLTATVTGQYGGRPTGTVNFMNGANILGTAIPIGGQATLARVFLQPGVKPLSAIYSGDANYSGSSSSESQVVNAGIPCTVPCFISSTVSYGGNTRYWGAYFPANLPASFQAIVLLPGAITAAYNDPIAEGSASSLYIGYPALVSFANANNVAMLWIMPTAYDASSNQWTPPFAQCLSYLCNTWSNWVWQLPWYFANTGTSPSDFFSYSASDPEYVHAMVGVLTGAWGTSKVIAIGSSTGGIFLNSYAQQYPDDFEAIGLFAGPLWAQNDSAGNTPLFIGGSNVNVFYVHGDADPILPYCGGLTSQPWTGLSNVASASTDQTFNYWANGMSCSTISTPLSLCTSGAPTTNLYSKVATGCAGGKSVQFMDIHNGRHKDAAALSPALISDFWNFAFPQNPAQ